MSIIALLIFSIFDYYFIQWNEFSDYFNNFDYIELLVMLGFKLTQLVMNISTLFAKKNNSPCHVFIILVFGQLAYYIKFDSALDIIIIVCLIIIFFLSFIFNEIYEINVLGLSFYTK